MRWAKWSALLLCLFSTLVASVYALGHDIADALSWAITGQLGFVVYVFLRDSERRK